MNNLSAPIYAENLKLRKSKVLFFSILGIFFISLMIGFFIFISNHPTLFNDTSLLSAKASAFAINDWEGFLTLMLQMIVFMGFIFYGFLTTYVFGREYSDRTLKDLLALPISRTSIILSKFIVVSIWSVIISIILFVSSILVGLLLNLDGWSTNLVLHVFYYYIIASILAILITTPVALVASIGRGYLAPFAYIIGVVVISQFINTGLPILDPYIPWIIPAIFSMSGMPTDSPVPALNIISPIIIIVTTIIGILGTINWWTYTDQI